MKSLLSLLLAVVLSSVTMSARFKMDILLEPTQTDSISIVELPHLGLAVPLGGDSLMIIDDELPVVHVKNYDMSDNFIATDSTFYYSSDYFIYSLSPSSGDTERVAILDNNQFSLYPATHNSFFAVTSDDNYSRCQLFDPVHKVYSDILEIDLPIFKVSANNDHLIVWAGDNLLLVGENGNVAPLITESSVRDFVLADEGVFFADDDGIYLIKSLTEQIKLSHTSVIRLWYIDNILYGLAESGHLFAIHDIELP